METVARESDGWTKTKAERALGAKLAEVERGMRKPRTRTFGDLLDEFVNITLPSRGLKKSTLADYKSSIGNHLRPEFGHESSSAPASSCRYARRTVDTS